MKVNLNLFKNFKTTASNAGINLKIDKNSEIYSKIQQELPVLLKIAKKENNPMTFVPKGENATLMNFGPYTTVLRNDDLQEKIAIQIYDHISKVRIPHK